MVVKDCAIAEEWLLGCCVGKESAGWMVDGGTDGGTAASESSAKNIQG